MLLLLAAALLRAHWSGVFSGRAISRGAEGESFSCFTEICRGMWINDNIAPTLVTTGASQDKNAGCKRASKEDPRLDIIGATSDGGSFNYRDHVTTFERYRTITSTASLAA
jgi:hypothetical protein